MKSVSVYVLFSFRAVLLLSKNNQSTLNINTTALAFCVKVLKLHQCLNLISHFEEK